MKNNEFYHSKIQVIDYPFDWKYLEEIDNNLIKNISKFNKTVDINEKIKLAKLIPIEFPKCRLCGNIILNSNFEIKLNKADKKIKINKPSVYCREIDNNKYYLSCCENCLLEHFKDDLPKSSKYYFMKANKYGAYSFGYSNEEYHKICSYTIGITEENMIRKWGKKEGKKRWKEYCNKQAITNTFKYKKEKYGWDKETFNKFNESRAITKENLINKYGEEKGLEIFDNYINKQKLTKSYDYMIKKYGEEKTNEINKSKALTLENFIKKYGKKNGLIKYEQTINKNYSFYSNLSQRFFNELDNILSKKYTTYYATKNKEYGVMLSNKQYVKLDYFIKELNLCIEFNGDCFHANPQIYKETDTPNPFNRKLTSKMIWENDNKRYKLLKEIRNIDTIIIWENEYNKGINIENFIKNTLKITI